MSDWEETSRKTLDTGETMAGWLAGWILMKQRGRQFYKELCSNVSHVIHLFLYQITNISQKSKVYSSHVIYRKI